MMPLDDAVRKVQSSQRQSKKPLAVILAGHNGSGKSTMWYRKLADTFQIPLINADRMMLSILPEETRAPLPQWARHLRDNDSNWMQVAQKGVEGFVALAMSQKAPFAMETVFSHWRMRPDGSFESKIDRIVDMQAAGYFVVLLFVGLSNAALSIARVSTRVAQGGHNVASAKLVSRFPRTQTAIERARLVADATIFTDNSRSEKLAFTVCRIQERGDEIFDIRNGAKPAKAPILAWLDVVAPRN